MSDQPSTSTYRNPKVEDDDDDDLDDLDDVLASFNAPPKPSVTKRPAPSSPPPTAPSRPAVPAPSGPSSPMGVGDDDDPDDDFEASLVEGMESLLRQLADKHQPGPMAGTSKEKEKAVEGDLSAEEEEKAWQRAVEMMLSGEGLDALGLDDKGQPKSTGDRPAVAGGSGGPGGSGGSGGKPDFDETIRRTMETLKSPKSTGSGGGGGKDDLAELLASLGKDPSALGGLGGGDDDDLGGLLDGMMAQLMTKEVLEEPMSELASKYPAYLASPPANVKPEDLEKYRNQYTLVSRIVATFQKPGYTDDKDGKEIARLVGEMQDLGGPPAEIMGELPEGFDLSALGNDDGCTIM